MNFKQRIKQLKKLKREVSSTEINNAGASFSSEVGGWTGGSSKGKFENYTHEIKSQAKQLTTIKSSIESAISKQIAKVQAQFDEQLSQAEAALSSVTGKDPGDLKNKELDKINSMDLDSSVKEELLKSIK